MRAREIFGSQPRSFRCVSLRQKTVGAMMPRAIERVAAVTKPYSLDRRETVGLSLPTARIEAVQALSEIRNAALAGAAFLAVTCFALAFPASQEFEVEPLTHEPPPPDVETWVDKHGFTCWEKTVCCDPTDRSTCTSFPVCSSWREGRS